MPGCTRFEEQRLYALPVEHKNDTVSELDILITPGIFPPDSGGPATFASDIAEALTKRGNRVRVVTNGTATSSYDVGRSYDVVRIRRGDSVPLRYIRQIWTLMSEIQDFDPDIVFSNAFDFQAVTASRLTRTPTIVKVVGDNAWERARRDNINDDIETFQQNLYNPGVEMLKLLRTLQTRGADRVVVPSKYLQEIVERWGISESATNVIYNSLDLRRRTVPVSERADQIITIGRLVPWKGISGIIDAFSQLDYTAELHIVGDGPNRAALEKHASRTDQRDKIHFHGQIEHQQVLEFLANSKVLTLNSTYEGLPHVVLEAMACGTPVIASAAGGTPEAIVDKKNGYLVEPGDAAAIADRCERLLKQTELQASFRDAGFELLDKRFNHTSMVNQYERLLHEVAAE